MAPPSQGSEPPANPGRFSLQWSAGIKVAVAHEVWVLSIRRALRGEPFGVRE